MTEDTGPFQREDAPERQPRREPAAEGRTAEEQPVEQHHPDAPYQPRRSRRSVLRRIFSVIVGLIAWAVSAVGASVLSAGAVERVQMLRYDRATTTYLLVGLGVLVVALLLWTCSAWLSSLGLLLTGLGSLAYGLVTFFRPSTVRWVFHLAEHGPVRFRSSTLYLAAGPFPIIVGMCLLIAGCAALVARRAGRRDVRRAVVA